MGVLGTADLDSARLVLIIAISKDIERVRDEQAVY